MAEARTCPLCGNAIAVRVGVVERHPKDRRATFSLEQGRPRRIEWCEASSKRWDEVAKNP